MFLSIVIPVYNDEKYLEECLDSCLNQSISPEEYEKYLDYNEQHNFVIESEPEEKARSPLDEQIDSIFD